MSTLRKKFEKIHPTISSVLVIIEFDESKNEYKAKSQRLSDFVNGAWWMFQELNKDEN